MTEFTSFQQATVTVNADSRSSNKDILAVATAFNSDIVTASRSGVEPPSIEQYLAENSDLPQESLLEALLAVEFEVHMDDWTDQQSVAYLQRFPDARDSIADTIKQVIALSTDPPPSVTLNLRSLTDVDGQPLNFREYQLLSELGEGGMGRVIRAWDSVEQKHVAIKFLTKGSLARSDERDRFVTEFNTAKRLQHNHIVPVYSLGEDHGSVFIVMDAIDGVTLTQWLTNRSLSSKSAARLLQTLASAVQYAHEQFVWHRDLTPTNILIDRDDKPWITDFGCARDLNVGSGPTVTADRMGTPHYMSPEQARGDIKAMDARSDVFALGAILYFCLTKRPPVEGDEARKIAARIIDGPLPVFPADLKVSRPLQIICHKCLRKRPAARYQSAQELAADLQRFLNGQKIRARAEPVTDRLLQWCRRSPWRAAAWALTLLLVVGSLRGVKWLNDERQIAVEALRIAEGARLDAVDAETVARQHQLQSESRLTRLVADGVMSPDRLSTLDDSNPNSGLDTQWLSDELRSRIKVMSRFLQGDAALLDGRVSPDCTRLATADLSGNLQVLDAETGALKVSLQTGCWHDTQCRWKRFTELTEAEAAIVITSVDWQNDNTLLATTRHGRLQSYNISRGELSNVPHTADQPLHFVRCVPDSEQILIAAADGTLTLLNDADSEPMAEFPANDRVTALEHCPQSNNWLVGYASGRLDILDAALKLIHTQLFEAPIVAVHDTSADSDVRLLLCAGRQPVQFLEFDSQQSRLNVIQSYDIARRRSDRTFQSVRATRQHVVAQDNIGRVLFWNRTSGFVVDDAEAGTTRIEDKDRPPQDLNRSLTHLFAISDDRFLVIDGSGSASFLHRDHDSVFAWQQLTSRVGEDSQLAAIPNRSGHFWCLSSNGTLRVIDAFADTTVAILENAHANARPEDSRDSPLSTRRSNEVVCLADGTAVTAGGDRFLKSWRLVDGTIVEIPECRRQHSANLLSVAVSEMSGMVAAVDEHSTLLVWDTQPLVQSAQPRRKQIEEPDQPTPTTGRVAFNCDGTLLFAFGSNQTRAIVDSKTLKDVPHSGGQVADLGGSSVTWSPVNPYCCLTASKNNLSAVFIDNQSDQFPTGRVSPVSSSLNDTVDSTATADGRRVLVLEGSGILRFFTGSHFIETSTWTVPCDACCSIAVGGTDEGVIVAASDGRVFRKFARQTVPIPTLTHDRMPGTRHVVLSPSGQRAFTASHRAAVNSEGLGALPVQLKLTRNHHAGELKLLRLRDGQWGLDSVGTHEPNGVVGVHDMGIAFDGQQRPYVAFREMVGDPENYDAHMVLAQETLPGHWKTEVVTPSGNAGHYPLLKTNDQGIVTDIFHFDFFGYYLQHSQRGSKTNEPWTTSTVRQGFGIRMNQLLFDGDDTLIFGRRSRFTVDHSPSQWLRIRRDGSAAFVDTANDARFLGRDRDSVVFANGQLPDLQSARSRQVELPASLRYADYLVMRMSPQSRNVVLASVHRSTGRVFLYSLIGDNWNALEVDTDSIPGERLVSAWLEAHNTCVMVIADAESTRLAVITGQLPSGFLSGDPLGDRSRHGDN